MTELRKRINQHDWTFEEKRQFFESRYSSCELLGDEGGADGYIYIQCRYCGNMFKHGSQCMRPSRRYKLICHNCESILRERNKRLKQEEAERRRNEVKYGDSRKYRQLGMKQCKICGQLFIQTHNRQTYCSTSCASYLHWKGKEAYRYKISLRVLYHRDQGICHICGEPCDWTDYKINQNGFIVYGNLYPTRDHIIPKSKGGEHSYQNIKLAHFICNSRRGDAI